MELTIGQINSGAYDGKEVWVCCFYFGKITKTNPERNIMPTKCMVESYKYTSYLKRRFMEIDRKGNLKKEILFSGAYSSETLSIFDNEVDCRLKHNDQCLYEIDRIEKYYMTKVQKIKDKMSRL